MNSSRVYFIKDALSCQVACTCASTLSGCALNFNEFGLVVRL
jgi:hypothetical protein